ncbi:hypothetical protein K2173_004917 [Erythroxylum novogranatense]|uniref:Diacylglycerol O-acyltransferase 3, cytosolic n=1 Tax=Erythroxylum novogranatense TaxID=1862640 RepID=A0AAV8UC90_9ROSI|nr:hypothetical protein K2173_004917 [Erythroxylum novogranatense]
MDMETARLIRQPVLGVSTAGVDSRSRKFAANDLRIVKTRVSFRGWDYGGFSDSGHIQYYESPVRCGMIKEKRREMKAEKKKMKLIERLSKDLASFSTDGAKRKTISEATEVLLAELAYVKAQHEEQKKRAKLEKAQREANNMCELESSSSSESSSDSDCGEVVDMRSNAAVKQTAQIESKQAVLDIATLTKTSPLTAVEVNELSLGNCRGDYESRSGYVPGSSLNACNDNNNDEIAVGGGLEGKIEVCMGGKCKKLGSVALMEKLQMMVGVEGAVVGCKCMGKCKNAPNVRVSKTSVEMNMEPSFNPLYIGVGLEDVGRIVAELLGKGGTEQCHLLPP